MKTPLSSMNENVIRKLRERVKELNCIYAISSIAVNDGVPFDRIIQDITDKVPLGFQHPESTYAEVIVADRRMRTGNFRTSPWRLEASILVNGEIAGKLEVGYIGALPGPDPPFLEEEKKLVESIANRIGAVLHFKVLQDSLETSEKRYRALVENSLMGIFQTTLDGRFVHANDICLKMLEYDSFAELEKVNAASLYRDPAKRRALVNRIKKRKKISNCELELLTRTGRPVTFLVTLSLEGTTLTGSAMDVTERKKIEEELRVKSLSLEETNSALKVLLHQGHKDLEELQGAFLSNVKHLVLPYLEQLDKTHLDHNQKALLTVIEANLRSMISPLLRNLFSIHAGFTPTEIKIAVLMREEKTVKEIAGFLGVSPSSVNLHRQNIRNKLGLTGKKVNLRTYLQSLSQ